nr:hypothetical protein [Tanacetum cinerariifolium]
MLASCKRPVKELRQCKAKAFRISSWISCYVKCHLRKVSSDLENKESLTPDITEFFRKLKCICHWADPFKDLKWSNVPGVKLSLFSKSDDTFLSLQALSNLHYLFSGFMDYLWSWMKCADLVRRSTMTQIVSCPLDVLGSFEMKSIIILSQFHVGISGCISYHQLRVRDKDIPKTAFKTSQGIYVDLAEIEAVKN